MLNLAVQLHSKAQGSYTTDVVTLGGESIPLEIFIFFFFKYVAQICRQVGEIDLIHINSHSAFIF